MYCPKVVRVPGFVVFAQLSVVDLKVLIPKIMLMQTQEIGRQNVENGTSYSRAGTARPNAQST